MVQWTSVSEAFCATNRFQHLAERRVDGAVDQQERQQEDRQHHVIQRGRLRQVEEAEHLALRNALDAVLAMGEGRLQIDEEQQLRQRQRDHGEIDALAADRDQAGDDAKPAGRQHADDDADLGGDAPHLQRMGRGVAGGAEEHGMAERQQAAIADQEVERAGEQRKAQRLHHEVRIEARQRHDGQQHPHDDEGDHEVRAHQQTHLVDRGGEHAGERGKTDAETVQNGCPPRGKTSCLQKAADKMLTMNPEAGRAAPLESGTLPRFENRYAAQT